MLRKLAISAAVVGTLFAFAPAAAAAVDPNSPEGALDGILQGFAGAFGSSQSTPRSRPQGGIYPDCSSCNAAAVRIRKPGVTAECNPVGGASGQYQLVVV